MSHHQDRQNLLGRFFKEIPNFREMVDSNMENPELQGLLDMVTGPHLARRDSGKAGFQGDLDHKANVAGLFKKAGGALSKLDKFSTGRGGRSFLNPSPQRQIRQPSQLPVQPVQQRLSIELPQRPQRPQAPQLGAGRPNLGGSFLQRLFGR